MWRVLNFGGRVRVRSRSTGFVTESRTETDEWVDGAQMEVASGRGRLSLRRVLDFGRRIRVRGVGGQRMGSG